MYFWNPGFIALFLLEAGCLLGQRKNVSGVKKTPPTFASQGRRISRGTTLVQLPVSQTALIASNKAVAGNGALRPALRSIVFRAGSSGTSIIQLSAPRLAPTAGSLRGRGCSSSRHRLLLMDHSSLGGWVCQVKISMKESRKPQVLVFSAGLCYADTNLKEGAS